MGDRSVSFRFGATSKGHRKHRGSELTTTYLLERSVHSSLAASSSSSESKKNQEGGFRLENCSLHICCTDFQTLKRGATSTWSFYYPSIDTIPIQVTWKRSPSSSSSSSSSLTTMSSSSLGAMVLKRLVWVVGYYY
jgi:hypothetical protein